MSAKRKHRTPNEYLKYLKGELSREERYTFERDLQADPFEMDAMEGMEQVPAGELEEDLLSVHAGMHKRLKRRRRRTFYYAAASVASLLIVGTVFLNIYNINPKSAQEAIPNDETFLHEDVTEQANVPVQEEKSTDRIILKEEKDMAMEQATVPVEAQNQDEIIVHEEMAMRAAEVVSAEVVSDEVISGVVEAPIHEAPVPVSKADELVVMEAQPKRSQKKARTQEAPSAYTTGQVSGIVVSSEDMEPLPGASITVKGSDSGMVADMEGRFSLVTDQQAQTTVIASYVGMETDEYQLAGGTENRVVMQPDMATLNEVVVIGYDADKETYATGAVQTVKLDKEESKYSGAEPEEGLEAYRMYIVEQIRFPAGDTISKREVVVLKFNVALDGSISQITTLRSPGDPFTEEAIRLLNEGPSWNPAKNESGATDDVVRMRIVFKR
jgi:hypothetical protein